MDAPPREPPCIWASKGAASNVVDNAAMANQRRIRRIIAPAAASVCQIFATSGERIGTIVEDGRMRIHITKLEWTPRGS